MSLATTDPQSGEPWCCQLFYAYLPEHGALVFTSAPTTQHIAQARERPVVAGSIVLESRVIGHLQGVQLTGTLATGGALTSEARTAYLKRFPYAAAMPLEMWVLTLESMKYTDNTLGFGTKLHWQRTAAIPQQQ